MRNKQILLSGRSVTTNAANVPADRYTFLHLSDAEPNLGIASANGWVLVYDTETPGNRLWSKNLITAYDHANSAYDSQNTSGSYANAAFLKANSAYASQNVTGTYANNAYLHANSAYQSQNTTGSYANSAFLKANSAYAQANSASLYANGAFVQANASYNSQNVTGTYANAAYAQANSASLYANGAFVEANSAYESQNTTGVYANAAFLQSNSAYAQANSASLYANGAFVQANAAYDSQNTTGTYANSAFLKANSAYAQANSASLYANGAFVQANAAYDSQNTTGVYANASFLKANSAYAQANSASLYANGAFVEANSAYAQANSASLYANGAFVQANAAYDSQNTTGVYANAAFLHSNSAYESQNTTGVYANASYAQANSASLYANGAFVEANAAFLKANSAYESQNVTGTYANNAYLHSNSAYAQANAGTTLAQNAYDNSNTKFNITGGTIAGNVTVANNLTVLGNVTFIGNVTSLQVTGNSGQFFGYSSNGFTALYAGIPVGYDFQPQTVFQVSANDNGYAQINIQNINPGGDASGDYVATADNGTELDTYVDLGIASSTHSDPEFTLVGPNDAYLYSHGNTSTSGGDLVIGTFLDNDVVFAAGGMNEENEQMRIIGSSNTITIRANLDTTNSKSITLGPVANVHIAGGSNDDYIRTDGLGNLTFASLTSANVIKVLYATTNASFIQANSSYESQNTTGVYANAAYSQANSASLYANGAFVEANSAYASQNTTGSYANASFLKANSAYDSQNVTGTYANTAYEQANSASLYANGAFIQANASYDSQNVTGTYANNAYAQANSAALYANGAFVQSNSAYDQANSAALYANGAFIQANAAYGSQNVTGTYANNAYLHANSAYASQNVTGTYANNAYLHANSAYSSQNTTGVYANASFLKANSAYASQNVTGTYANNAYLHANSAYVRANNSLDANNGGSVTGTVSVTGNLIADYVIANSGFASTAGGSKLQLSDIGLVVIDVAGQQFKFGGGGIESSPGIYGGSFGGNKLSLSNETNLISNRYDTVKIQTGTDGTVANEWIFGNTSLTAPGNITATGFIADGINIAPYAIASFTHANSAYASQNVTGTYANNAYLHANAAFTKVNVAVFSVTTNVNELYSNTSSGNIRVGLATVNSNVGEFGSASQVPVLTIDKFGRIVSAYNSTITIPPGTYIYPNVGQLTSNANYGDVLIGLANVNVNIGTFGSQFAVPTITTDGYGRILAISNTTISIPQGTYIVNSDFITANSQTGNVVLGLSESGVTAGTYGGTNFTPVIEVDVYGRITFANNVSTTGTGSGGSVNTLSTVVKTSYTATAGQTAFSTATSFEPGYIDVYINGLHLSPNDYGANGSLGQITINSPSLFDGDVVDIQTVTTYVVNANTVYQKQTFIATAGQTTVITNYDPGNINVYLNGLRLLDGTDYTAVNGINIVFPIALEVSDVVEVEKIGRSEIYIANTTLATKNTITVTANGDSMFIVGGGYRTGFTDVFMNGIKLNIPGDVTALDGNTITIISTSTEVGDIIEVNSMGPSYSLANAIPITGGTVYGGLNVVQNITANSANVGTLYFNDGTSMATAASGSGGSGITWKIATANTTANSGEGILVDTTTANVHITLNASPMLGNTVRIVDMTSNFAINNCIIQRNGQKIMGLNENLVISSNNAGIGLVFSNSTNGWRIIENP